MATPRRPAQNICRTDEITVLYVDGDAATSHSLAESVEREDERITVLTATDARGALDQFADGGADCIVSDYEMPKRDGIDLLKSVREDDPDLPFILFTDSGSERVASEAISAGVTDYLRKESSGDQYALLADRIVDAVDEYRAAGTVERQRDVCRAGQEIADIGFWEYDVEAETVYTSEGLLGLCGVAAQPDLRKEQLFDSYYPDDRPAIRDAFDRAVEAGESFDLELRLIDDDGHERWVRTQGEPRIKDGDTVRVRGSVQDVTEHKAQKRDLREDRDRYRHFVERATDVITVADTDGTIRYESPAVERIFGYPPEERVGDPVFEYVHPDDRQRVLSQFRELVDREADTAERIEFRYEGVDGSYRWIESIGTDRTETVINGVVVYSRDITDRKEREREIQQLTERLKLAVDGAGLGIWDWDMTTDEVEFNDQWAEILGYTPDEIEPHLDAWEKRVHPEDADPVQAALKEHIRDGTDFYETEHRMRTADGDWKWIRDIGRIVERDDDGTPLRAVGVHLDIDERKAHEQELERARRELRQIIDLIPDLVFAKNREGEYLLANEAAAELYGTTRENIEGRKEQDVIPDPADAEEFRQDDLEVIESGEPKYIPEEEITTADGETRILQTRKIPFEVPGRDEEAVLGYARDVTDLKQRERDLKRRNQQLDKFARIVSHDLRNPLEVASGRLELARQTCGSPHLDDIETALDRIDTIIADTLALARLGQTINEKQDIDLRARAEECWDSVETAGASFDPPESVTIRADPDRLKHVCENLFRNAIEHGGEGVTVSVDRLEDGFAITDDGSGLPEDVDIFEPGATTSADGNGFGLAIVEEIVTAHGWDIHATESEDGGARFEITDVDLRETGER
ncbi:Signal transduction histidine kinase [Halapricum desulfuricans]|uniref:histidine kinase n=1 Tax=Halapricum desulfuricans TaxID=2841257 RepID=A0A897NAZ4_9EURY|nr:PAS domain S-box protein [Halapricum desulfuricans]QSG11580.1 Signal transduction histidine kinase [Halapricum desulfuricans]